MKTWKLIDLEDFIDLLYHREIRQRKIEKGVRIIETNVERFKIQGGFEVQKDHTIRLLAPQFYQEIEQSDRDFVLEYYPDAKLYPYIEINIVRTDTKELGQGNTITEAWHNAAIGVAGDQDA